MASEILKQGVFATITYGNMKGADIYAIGPNRKAAVIEVKASNSDRFVTGFYQKYEEETKQPPDFWVLYSLKSNGDERFFVLTHRELAKVQAERNYPGKSMTWAEQAVAVEKELDNVLAKDFGAYESTWEKITKWCSPKSR